ncbi:MAG: hypothetical protein J5818_00315 [Eggerthellaceae bacterium]|nr:hypothetical protein [Eggerthellaceae bacterium]
MAGSFDFLHIKRHTAGSSNELSFDVLEAASSQLSDKGKKSSRIARTPGISRGSYHGVAGTSTLSAVPEVERRKKARRARAVRIRVFSVLVAIVAVGALGFAGYSFYQSRVDFSERYHSLVSELAAIDEELVKVDAIMVDPLASGTEEARTEAKANLERTAKRLDDVSDATEKTVQYSMGDKDNVALTQLASAIEGRKAMLAAAAGAFGVAEQYDQELGVAKRAWSKVLDADQKACEASASANSASTDEATEAAKQMTQDALDQFADARSELEGVGYRYEGVDFSAQITYLDKRIESLEYAIATADALVAGDRQAATENNDAYNAADEEAVRLAQSLPLLIDEQVKSAFMLEIEPYSKRYNDARADVWVGDADIRAYLAS